MGSAPNPTSEKKWPRLLIGATIILLLLAGAAGGHFFTVWSYDADGAGRILTASEEELSRAQAALTAIKPPLSSEELPSDAIRMHLEQAMSSLVAASQQIAQERRSFVDLRHTFSSQILQILFFLIAVISAIGYLTAAIIRQRVTETASEEVLEKVKKVILQEESKFRSHVETTKTDLHNFIDIRAEYNVRLTQAMNYCELSFTWWKLHRSSPNQSKDSASYLSVAYEMSCRGVDQCETEVFRTALDNEGEISKESTKSDPRRVYAVTINNWVSHAVKLAWIDKQVYERICQDQAERQLLLDRARKCLTNADQPFLSRDWYLIKETAISALITFGNDREREEGEDLLKLLLFEEVKPSEESSSPPQEWIKEKCEEYNAKFDLGLQSP